jgi:hypothetical protein
MRAPIFATIAALAASAVASPLATRTVYAAWPATEVQDQIAHILVGEYFRLIAPAGYVAGAPGFDVRCTPTLLDKVRPAPCTYNSEQGQGESVAAEFLTNGTVSVTHAFGSKKAYGVSEVLSGLPLNNDFTVDVIYFGAA